MKQTRECRYDKTIGISHDDRQGVAVISVSNRQKPMMVRYGRKVAGAVAIRMEMALAQYRGQLPRSWPVSNKKLAAIDRTKPAAPSGPQESLLGSQVHPRGSRHNRRGTLANRLPGQ